MLRKACLLPAFALVSLLALGAPAQAQRMEWEDWVERARKAEHESHPQEALQMYWCAYHRGGTLNMLQKIIEQSTVAGFCADAKQANQKYRERTQTEYPDFAERIARCEAQNQPPATSPPPKLAAEPCVTDTQPTAPPPPASPPTLSPPPQDCPICSATQAVSVAENQYFACTQQLSAVAARRCFRQVLTAAGNVYWDSKALEDVLNRLTIQVPAQAPSRIWVKRRNDGLWAAGLTLWLGAFVPTLVAPPILIGDHPGFNDAYYLLMVPVAGPFISGILMPSNFRDPQSVWLNYSIPWMVADGVSQVAGLIMLGAGLRQRWVPLSLRSSRPGIQVQPYASPAGFGISGRY